MARFVFIPFRNHQRAYFHALATQLGTEGQVIDLDGSLSLTGCQLSIRELHDIARLQIRFTRNRCLQAVRPWCGALAPFLYAYFFVLACGKAMTYGSPLRRLRSSGSCVCLWGERQLKQDIVKRLCHSLGVRVIHFENGLLPGTTTVDAAGVNYHNSLVREAAFYLGCQGLDRPAPVRPAQAGPPSQGCPNTQRRAQPRRPYVLVPFQLDADSQIVAYSPWIRDMYHLYREICFIARRLPDMDFVLKTHPANSRCQHFLNGSRHPDNVSIHQGMEQDGRWQLLEDAAGVVTVNSTMGLEALALEQKVITLGQAFYNIEGLVWQARDRNSLLDLLANLDALTPDVGLIRRFIRYVRDVYCVDGDWRAASGMHLREVEQRLLLLCAGRG